MNKKILCVDDDPNVLAGLERQLYETFETDLAIGAEAGLAKVGNHGPYAVVLSDMRMPGMSGVEFLTRVRQIAPTTVRMMLTGVNDQETAVSAVNKGNIFRFLNKPCESNDLIDAISAGLEQYRLVMAEKELLEQTLQQSIKVLTEMLSLVCPIAFGRAMRVQAVVKQLAETLQVADVWQIEVAAMLSHLGCITVPEPVLAKGFRGEELDPFEMRMLANHHQTASAMVAKIPRLEAVAKIIACQKNSFDNKGFLDEVDAGPIPFEAQILKVALDYDILRFRGYDCATAIDRMRVRKGWYDPGVFAALEAMGRKTKYYSLKMVPIDNLRCGMIVGEDILSGNNFVLVGKGQEISETMLRRLHNFLGGTDKFHLVAVVTETEQCPVDTYETFESVH